MTRTPLTLLFPLLLLGVSCGSDTSDCDEVCVQQAANGCLAMAIDSCQNACDAFSKSALVCQNASDALAACQLELPDVCDSSGCVSETATFNTDCLSP